MRHAKFVEKTIDDKGTTALVLADEDVWYVLSYEVTNGVIVITYYDQTLPILRQRPIHKRIKHTYSNGTPNIVLASVLNNYEAYKDDTERFKEYEPTKVYTQDARTRDLTDISNNIKKTGMPDDFRRFFFGVDEANATITIRTFVTKADIDSNCLDTVKMDEYLHRLKDFVLVDKEAGWADYQNHAHS